MSRPLFKRIHRRAAARPCPRRPAVVPFDFAASSKDRAAQFVVPDPSRIRRPIVPNPGYRLKRYASNAKPVAALWAEFQRLHADGYTHVLALPTTSGRYEYTQRVGRLFHIVCLDRKAFAHVANQCAVIAESATPPINNKTARGQKK